MVTAKQLALALIESVKENPDNTKVVLKNFEIFLDKNHLKELIPNIIKSLEDEVRRRQKETLLEITTSHDITTDTISLIEKFVNKKSKDQILLMKDENLIGGFVARYAGIVYDGSVRHHISQLKAILMK